VQQQRQDDELGERWRVRPPGVRGPGVGRRGSRRRRRRKASFAEFGGCEPRAYCMRRRGVRRDPRLERRLGAARSSGGGSRPPGRRETGHAWAIGGAAEQRRPVAGAPRESSRSSRPPRRSAMDHTGMLAFGRYPKDRYPRARPISARMVTPSRASCATRGAKPAWLHRPSVVVEAQPIRAKRMNGSSRDRHPHAGRARPGDAWSAAPPSACPPDAAHLDIRAGRELVRRPQEPTSMRRSASAWICAPRTGDHFHAHAETVRERLDESRNGSNMARPVKAIRSAASRAGA